MLKKYTMHIRITTGILALLLLAACTYTLKVKDGRTAYERKQFAVATPMLEKEFGRAKTRNEKGQIAYLLGDSYRRIGRDEKSLEWFKTAYDNNGGAEALKAYAFALKKLERYAEAREAFKNLGIEIGSPYEYRKEITACTVAEGWLKEMPTNGWAVQTTSFNSAQNDFAPILAPDGRLVFSSDRSMSTGEEKYNWTGNHFMDIFIVDPNNASPQVFDNQLNTENNEATPCFSKTGDEVFFVRAVGAYKGDDAYNKVYTASRAGGEGSWGTPIPMPYQKEKVNYLHPALSADGNTLYFSSNDPEGWGGFDLYAMQRSAKTENGWEEPKLLTRAINTPGNEVFPSFDADTLYFASDGLLGMGGLDIFRTYKIDRTTWAPPINLKAPLNSGADDFGMAVSPGKNKAAKQPGDLIRSGFITSNRSMEGARGGDDILRFDQKVPPPKPPKKDTIDPKSIVYKLLLDVYVLEKILSDPADPNSKILGRKPLADANLQIDAGKKPQTVKINVEGLYKLEMSENTDYQFSASMPGYLSNTARFSTKGMAKDPANPVQSFELEIVLDKIFRDREIVLENIYYDYDKWDIRPDAEPTLNRLADVLRQNPTIRIQLGSHTDCRGNDSYNQTLSQRRAESAVNYLISKGIEADRLSARGYGETQPAADCACARCTESEHQTNRRTTFKIVE